ncbi:hypothetical protein CRG98_011101 [Punica granatum]|uniref:Uncharacterized protein n=1 Tax=Punica granatum TaxID=22663 RepID=A0A2I0KJ13_PUNGR|nr:hypothetical protein CRG98_011101 [Punica granatum]
MVDRPSDRDHLFTGRVRVVRNPLNAMARLAEVVGRNGTWLARCARLGKCSGIIVRCSEIVVVSVFRGNTPKVRRETFVTTETYFGKPSRVPEGCLKLVPRPWGSLGVCKPVLRGRLFVSGAGPGSSCLSSSPIVHDLRARLFASDYRAMNSVPGFGRESSCGKPVRQNGVLTVSQRFRIRERIESAMPPNRPPKILARFQGIHTLVSGAPIPS